MCYVILTIINYFRLVVFSKMNNLKEQGKKND